MPTQSVLQNWLDDFDYMIQNTEWGVLTYTCHPFVSGRGHRMLMFGEYLEIRDHTLKLLFGEGKHVAVMINETSRAKRTDRFIKQDTLWYFRVACGVIQHWQVFEDTEQVGWAWEDGATRRAE